MRSKVDSTKRGNGAELWGCPSVMGLPWQSRSRRDFWLARGINLSPKKEIKEGNHQEDAMWEIRILVMKLASFTLLSRLGPRNCFRYKNVFCAYHYAECCQLWSSHTQRNNDTDMMILILEFRDQLWAACIGHPDGANLLVWVSTWKSTVGGPLLFHLSCGWYFHKIVNGITS